MTGQISTVVLVLLVLFWAVGAYKRLVSLRKQCKKALAQLGGQLQRRYDVIPRLLDLVIGHMDDEHETCDILAVALNRAAAATAAAKFTDRAAMQEMASAESMLSVALDTLREVLKENAEISRHADVSVLIEDLSSIDERIAFTWQVYNDAASQYNASRMQFPVRIIAIIFAFGPAHPLDAMAAVNGLGTLQQ